MSAVLVAPPAGGNIGDQALVESAILALPGDVDVVVRHRGDVHLDHLASPDRRIRETVLPDLIFGNELTRRIDRWRFKRLVRDAEEVFIVGADIMDGHYNPAHSIARSQLAAMTAARGKPVVVLGFSWNGNADEGAVAALKAAADAGAVLYSRDPVSGRRLRQCGIESESGADIVFTVADADTAAADKILRNVGVAAGEDFVLVNASGLISAVTDQTTAYVNTLRALQARGITPVLIPHVSRPSGDDQNALDELAKAFPGPLPRIETLELPDVIRGLCTRARAVVTGRMHLGIMALRVGTPAVIVATQGKVEGLLEMFDMPECCVDPGSRIDVELPEAVARVVDTHDVYTDRIAARLPMVIGLASNNFTIVNGRF